MAVQIVEIGTDRLADYASVPIKFEVKSTLQVELVDGGLGGMLLRQVPVEKPYAKDYDAYGEIPTDWPKLFDVTHWGFFLAMDGERPVGGGGGGVRYQRGAHARSPV
ncbi:MAG: hypothetical protein IMZ62_01050 [Chloroflexi bacterium]|nr:hypothetical protein [Chloroflexota bacterium]